MAGACVQNPRGLDRAMSGILAKLLSWLSSSVDIVSVLRKSLLMLLLHSWV